LIINNYSLLLRKGSSKFY